MKFKPLGESGIQISTVIMGTWQAGKSMWTGIVDAETIKAIRAAFDAGITTVDTAAAYGDGHSEKIVAKALGDVRPQVVYATKVFANRLKYDQVISACHQSLKHLNTDYIDLFQIHWPAGSFGSQKVPIDESMGALNDLREQGKIRAIGVSNFSGAQLEAASQFGRIDSLQPPYSLFWRHVERDALGYCAQHQVSVLAYSSLAQGLLTGKFGPDHRFAKGDHRSKNRLLQPEHYQRVQQALERLRPIARRHEATLGQLALAWVLAQNNTCAIAGARSASQVRENARAVDLSLTAADLEQMDAIGRTVTDFLDDNPKMWKF